MELGLHSFSGLLTLWTFARVEGFCLCSVQHSNSAAALVVRFFNFICYHSKSFGCRDVACKAIFQARRKEMKETVIILDVVIICTDVVF